MAGTEYIGGVIPAPGFINGNYGNDDELLYSMVGYTQKGVTLLSGQGVLPLGTALARQTATKRYVKYNSGGSDGSQNFAGFLRHSVDTGLVASGAGVQDQQGNIVIVGILKLTQVSSANGGLTALLSNVAGSRANADLGSFTF